MAEEKKKKLIRFPLQLADGTGARSLEELREHGDVESILKHYREGTLARWLRAFGQQELAEKVAEHRNAQVEGSKANLQGLFPLLGIPLEEEAFSEYCKNKMSDKFVFSDAEGGDLKPYGQEVSIKDKLVDFLPEGKLPGGEPLEDWEVTETELDGGNLLVELTCEKRSILVSLQFAREDECYKKIANQLERMVNAFNPAEPQDQQENVESEKINNHQEPRNYRIGDTSLSGGIIFHIDGSKVYMVSEVLGRCKWDEAEELVEGCHRGGFFDWRLPTKEELNLVYQNLRKPGIIRDKDWFCRRPSCPSMTATMHSASMTAVRSTPTMSMSALSVRFEFLVLNRTSAAHRQGRPSSRRRCSGTAWWCRLRGEWACHI